MAGKLEQNLGLEKPTRSKTYENYKTLLKAVKRSGLDVCDFEDKKGIETRRWHFKSIFHYSSLNGPGGEPIPIDEIPNEMLCKAHLSHYKRAEKLFESKQGFLFDIY